ncbi:hypothetical protein [Micromonospora rosaria]|uniref:hypothetical protein n=1 Tax=Micromonospora rosaria TaxID=47874 RepID=UPI000AC4C99B|nr:hypothetical protein [Micromonospora rosaria]
MNIMADVRPCAHTALARRTVASYAGTAAGLRAALRIGAAATCCTQTTVPAGGAR